MKKIMLMMLVFLVVLYGEARGEDRKALDDVLLALTDLQNIVQTGVLYQDYVRELPKLTKAYNAYRESGHGTVEFLRAVGTATLHYRLAAVMWEGILEGSLIQVSDFRRLSMPGAVVCTEVFQEYCEGLLKKYPKMRVGERWGWRMISAGDAVSAAWNEASVCIEKAKELAKGLPQK
jgi:hypothetical protein